MTLLFISINFIIEGTYVSYQVILYRTIDSAQKSMETGGINRMTVNIRTTEAQTSAQALDIIALYRTMVTARTINDLLKTRKTQGRFPFYIGCAGHESMESVVAALNEDDWLSLYYCDLAAQVQRTGDLYVPLRQAYT